jgi:hypothetical protein
MCNPKRPFQELNSFPSRSQFIEETMDLESNARTPATLGIPWRAYVRFLALSSKPSSSSLSSIAFSSESLGFMLFLNSDSVSLVVPLEVGISCDHEELFLQQISCYKFYRSRSTGALLLPNV